MTSDRGNRQRNGETQPQAWAPGELLVSLGVSDDELTRLEQVHEHVKNHVRERYGVELENSERGPIHLEHPNAGGLVVTHLVLRRKDARAVRDTVVGLNSAEGRRALRPSDSDGLRLEPAGAMPNWLAAAQDCVGGSPGSLPAIAPNAHKDRLLRYRPELRNLDLADQAAATVWAREGARGQQVHAAVLDTAPSDLHRRAEALGNVQLNELLEQLAPDIGRVSHAHLDQVRASALDELVDRTFRAVGATGQLSISDHGLFVASIIHAVAPWARIRLVRVLNDYGIGKLDGIIAALAALLHSPAKKPGAPLVVNLSLGILPPMEQIPWLWHGLAVPGLPEQPQDPELRKVSGDEAPRSEDWLRANFDAVQQQMWRLQEPIYHLMSVLQAHNCLIVAAAGNDSLARRPQDPRWQPRVPACYDNVLGVAATRREYPYNAASYSNQGDLPPLQDAVATWGGDVDVDENAVSPVDGVIGLYSATAFPSASGLAGAPNQTGWGQWSGTSFAAPIMAGIALNMWTLRLGAPSDDAASALAAINAAVRSSTSSLVPGLNVRPVPIAEPRWEAQPAK